MIYYFSATGNSRHVANRLAQSLNEPVISVLDVLGKPVFVEDRMELAEGITLHSCNDRRCTHPVESYGLNTLEDGQFLPDSFRHEQYLLVEEAGKTVCFSGCSHKGILNIAQWFRPDVLVGGFHFVKLDPQGSGGEILEKAAKQLLEYPTTYYTGHCTGNAQFAFLKERMGNRLNPLPTGTVIEISTTRKSM